MNGSMYGMMYNDNQDNRGDNMDKIRPIQFYTRVTISAAVTTKPINAEVTGTAGYTRVLVYDNIHRIPKLLQLHNEGPGNLFFIVSHGEGYQWSDEVLAVEGEDVVIYDAYEIRVRVTSNNTTFHVSEYEHYKSRDFVFKTGLPYISETTVAAVGTPNNELVNASLGKNAVTGYFINDGPGNLLVQISVDGTNFSTQFTMIPNQTVNFAEEIFTLRIDTSVAGTAYRLNLH